MSKWFYKGKCITYVGDMPECCQFMVYRILFPDQTYYLGSKQAYFIRKTKLSKKRANELYSGKGGKKKFEQKVKESDWLNYQSSSKKVQERLLTEEAIFEILEFYPTKQHMLLAEAVIIGEAFLRFDEKILNEWLSFKGPRIKREV